MHAVGDKCIGTEVDQDSGAPKCSNNMLEPFEMRLTHTDCTEQNSVVFTELQPK